MHQSSSFRSSSNSNNPSFPSFNSPHNNDGNNFNNNFLNPNVNSNLKHSYTPPTEMGSGNARGQDNSSMPTHNEFNMGPGHNKNPYPNNNPNPAFPPYQKNIGNNNRPNQPYYNNDNNANNRMNFNDDNNGRSKNNINNSAEDRQQTVTDGIAQVMFNAMESDPEIKKKMIMRFIQIVYKCDNETAQKTQRYTYKKGDYDNNEDIPSRISYDIRKSSNLIDKNPVDDGFEGDRSPDNFNSRSSFNDRPSFNDRSSFNDRPPFTDGPRYDFYHDNRRPGRGYRGYSRSRGFRDDRGRRNRGFSDRPPRSYSYNRDNDEDDEANRGNQNRQKFPHSNDDNNDNNHDNDNDNNTDHNNDNKHNQKENNKIDDQGSVHSKRENLKDQSENDSNANKVTSVPVQKRNMPKRATTPPSPSEDHD